MLRWTGGLGFDSSVQMPVAEFGASLAGGVRLSAGALLREKFVAFGR